MMTITGMYYPINIHKLHIWLDALISLRLRTTVFQSRRALNFHLPTLLLSQLFFSCLIIHFLKKKKVLITISVFLHFK